MRSILGEMRAVVVANGALPDVGPFRRLLAAADLVVAADGGARTLLRSGVAVDLLLGDFDSLEPDLLNAWRADGGATLEFPAEKDETDLELALRHVRAHGATHIVILGALGGRLDHELANLLLLASPLLEGADVRILDAHTLVRAVRGAATLSGKAGDLLSLLPITERVENVHASNVRYPLDGDTLLLGPSRGVSNEFAAEVVTLSVGTGVLLAIHTWDEEREQEW